MTEAKDLKPHSEILMVIHQNKKPSLPPSQTNPHKPCWVLGSFRVLTLQLLFHVAVFERDKGEGFIIKGISLHYPSHSKVLHANQILRKIRV